MPHNPSPENKIHNPFAELVGITFTEVEKGSTVCTVEVKQHLLNPNHVVHGGVSYAMADTGMAYALVTVLSDELSCATVEIKLTYLRPVSSGSLICKSWVVSKSRRLGFTEAEVFNNDQLIAKGSGTFSILRMNADNPNANG